VCGKDLLGVNRSRSATGCSDGEVSSVRAPLPAGRVGRTAVPQCSVQATGRQAAGDAASGRGHRWRGRGRVRGRPAVLIRRPGGHMLSAVAVARPQDRRTAEEHTFLPDGQTTRHVVLQPVPLEQTMRNR